MLLDLGMHVVDQALFLLGPVTLVYAEVATRRAGAAVDDDCFLALTHTSGAVSHLWCSAAAPWRGPRLVVQGTRAGWVKNELDGQEDALRAGLPLPLREPAGQLWTTDSRPAEIDSLPGDWGAFYRELAAAILDGGPVPVDGSAAVRALLVLEAARESARVHRVVSL